MSSLEKTTETHSQEVQELQALLSTQKQLASRFSDQVAELEQGSRLKELALKEVQQELLVEKTVSSKLYDEVCSTEQCSVQCYVHAVVCVISTERRGVVTLLLYLRLCHI